MHARPSADSLTIAARPHLPPVSRPGDPREREAERAPAGPPATSFGSVKIHADEDADRMAGAIGARAFTARDHVYFRRGEYAPHTESGRRLLAHELAHVAQDNTDALHRQPGRDASDSWSAITTPVAFRPDVTDRHGPANEAVSRMLRLAEGARLVNQLWTTFCARGACRSRIRIAFVDQSELDRVSGEGPSASGHFSPAAPGEPVYDILVAYSEPLAPDVRRRTLSEPWPSRTAPQVVHYTHVDSESSMASTLYHELLHVWFVNTQEGASYPTGHMNVERGEIEPLFLERLRTFSRQLDELEETIHRQAAPPAAPPQPPLGSRDIPEPRERVELPGPSLLGGELSLHGGGATGPGPGRGAGIVGADFILGNIHSLRLGARGIYLTPETLLVGGTVGYRILQSPEGGRPGERVERPMFFDLEAGVLAELTPNQAARVSNGLTGIAGAGVGQEFGTSGPRFFWRVGGMVLISDRDVRRPAFVGTGGAGVRF